MSLPVHRWPHDRDNLGGVHHLFDYPSLAPQGGGAHHASDAMSKRVGKTQNLQQFHRLPSRHLTVGGYAGKSETAHQEVKSDNAVAGVSLKAGLRISHWLEKLCLLPTREHGVCRLGLRGFSSMTDGQLLS